MKPRELAARLRNAEDSARDYGAHGAADQLEELAAAAADQHPGADRAQADLTDAITDLTAAVRELTAALRDHDPADRERRLWQPAAVAARRAADEPPPQRRTPSPRAAAGYPGRILPEPQ